MVATQDRRHTIVGGVHEGTARKSRAQARQQHGVIDVVDAAAFVGSDDFPQMVHAIGGH